MKDEIKEDEFIKNNRKFFNYLINLRNRDLRKEIENCNWNAILQLIRYCGYEVTNLQEENERLNNIIKIMEKYFELIVDLGYDYDGFNTVESLKALIDELRRYASLGRVYNTTEPIFINNDKTYNILNEELKEEEKKIPEKLNKDRYIGTDLSVEDDMFDKINEIIDYLKNKGE